MGASPIVPGRVSFSRCGQGGRRLKREPVFRPTRFQGSYVVSGTTRDGVGAPLPNVPVKLFSGRDDSVVAQMTSDGSGLFSFSVGTNSPVYVMAYLPGSPDRAGISVFPLSPVPV